MRRPAGAPGRVALLAGALLCSACGARRAAPAPVSGDTLGLRLSALEPSKNVDGIGQLEASIQVSNLTRSDVTVLGADCELRVQGVRLPLCTEVEPLVLAPGADGLLALGVARLPVGLGGEAVAASLVGSVYWREGRGPRRVVPFQFTHGPGADDLGQETP